MKKFIPVLVPAVIGCVALALGHSGRAIAILVLAALLFLATLAGLPVERAAAKLGELISHGLATAFAWLLGIFLVATGGVLRLFRSDPLVPRRSRNVGWESTVRTGDAKQLSGSVFAVDNSAVRTFRERSRLERSLRLAGVVMFFAAALLLARPVATSLRDRLAPKPETVEDRINFSGNAKTFHDPRADLPAMESYPWADAYFREAQINPTTYWPFTESKPLPFKGKYITIGNDWTRKSYTPRGSKTDRPTVWMFGGSTTWGEAQRDNYTIASYLARIAEGDKLPITIKNYGQRGWTHFQEMILFEQLLAEGPVPDIVIFYDGANEVNAQTLGTRDVPSHTMQLAYAQKISGGLGENGDKFVAPTADKNGIVTRYDTTLDDAKAAVDVYERGRTLSKFLADRKRVASLFFWQPVIKGPIQAWTNDHVSKPTINISDALDDYRDVYVDGGHTNERGAKIVAERIWKYLKPKVQSANKRN